MIRASETCFPIERLNQSAAYRVRLASVGNPDFGQDPTRQLHGVESKFVNALSIADAAQKCREFIDKNDLGGGNWNGGQVYLGAECVAVISYNGRAWIPLLQEASKEANLPRVISTTLEYSPANLERNRKFGLVTKSGVVYDEELAGPSGMTFVLLRESHTTDEMIAAAALQLHRDRDVVGSIKVTGVIESEAHVQAPQAQIVAIFVGSVVDGFSLSQVLDRDAAHAFAEITSRAEGRKVEIVEIKSPKTLDKKQDHPLESDSVFLGFSSGYGSGLKLFGPFPADGIDAQEFGEAHRDNGAGWEIWAVTPQAEETERPRPSA
jgi:hypothetical protein